MTALFEANKSDIEVNDDNKMIPRYLPTLFHVCPCHVVDLNLIAGYVLQEYQSIC